MRSRFLICGAGVFIAIGAVMAQVRDSRTTSDSGISRRLVVDEKTVQVMRTIYKPGAVEPPGLRVEIAGKTVRQWHGKWAIRFSFREALNTTSQTGEKQQWITLASAFLSSFFVIAPDHGRLGN